MPAAPIEFWFEFASPYSYIAASRLPSLCAAAGVELRWRPFLLGPVFALQGWDTSPFTLNPRRGAYMMRDLERLCAKFGLPWQRPSVFPRHTVFAARVAAAHQHAPWLPDYVERIYRANFGEDRELDEPVVGAVLTALHLDAATILATANTGPLRSQLRTNTQTAIDHGIFGAPNCLVDGELFWGEEALEDAIAWALHAHPAVAGR